MDIDLANAVQDIRDYIRKRVRAYKRLANDGPGKPGDPITLITLGYQIDQDGWVALVFDTRPQPDCDGNWQSHIEDNDLPFLAWHRAFTTMTASNQPIRVVLADGKVKTLRKTMSMKTVCTPFGRALKAALLGAWRDGDFAALPLAKGCRVAIEEHEGNWGWTNLKSQVDYAGAERNYKKIMAGLRRDAEGMSEAERIAHWLAVIEKEATGPWVGCLYPYLPHKDACEELADIGHAAVMPTLDLLFRWADQPDHYLYEMIGASPFNEALEMVEASGLRTTEVERRLCEIIQKSATYNAGQERWGRVASRAALYLSRMFDRYPKPVIGESNLAQPEAYVYRT